MTKIRITWVLVSFAISIATFPGCSKPEPAKTTPAAEDAEGVSSTKTESQPAEPAKTTSTVRFDVKEKGDKLEFFVDNESYELGELSQPKEFSFGEHLVSVRREGDVLFEVPFDVVDSEEVEVVDVISPMRTAALAIIEASGTVRIVDPKSEVKEASALPSNYFEFDGVFFYRKQFDESVLEVLKTIDDFRLRRLSAADSNISDKGIKTISDLSHLNELGLERTNVTSEGLRLIAEAAPPLNRVFVNGLDVPHQFFDHLHNCRLDIFGASDTNFSDKDLAALKGRSFWFCHLDGTRITDAGLKTLAGTKFKMLRLSNTQISDEGVKHCLEFEELKEIDLRETRVTEAGLDLLRERFPDIKIAFTPSEKAN